MTWYFGYDDKLGEIDILVEIDVVEIDIQLCFVYLLSRWLQMFLLWQNLTLGKGLWRNHGMWPVRLGMNYIYEAKVWK